MSIVLSASPSINTPVSQIGQPLLSILTELNPAQLVEVLAYVAGIGSRDRKPHLNIAALDLALVISPVEVHRG
jgi:hypothetical protein